MSAHTDAAPETGLKSQVMSALRWSAVAKLGGQLISWAITLFVMRLLAPADYGLVAMLTLIIMFLGMLGEMGFGASVVQSKDLQPREIEQTIGAALLVNFGICALLFVCAPAIASFYGEPQLVDMTRVSALAFIGAGVSSVYAGLLQREMRFKATARIEIVSGLAGSVATLALAFWGFGAWALILGPLVASPLRAAMLFASARRLYRPSFRFEGSRRLWSFGGNVLGTRVIWYWASQVDVLIAAKLLGKDATGFYSVAMHLASLPMQRASGMINGVAFAAFARIQHDPRAVAHNTRLGIRLMAFVTFPVLWGIASVAPELVEIAIGPAWQQSILPLTLIALTIPFRMIGSIVSTTIMSMGRVDIALKTTIIGALVAPPIFFVGAQWDIVGLSVAWLVVAPVLFLLNMFRALPILGLSLKDVIAEMWRPATVAAVMFILVEGARQLMPALANLPRFALLIVLGAATYAGGSWLLNRLASVEALTLLFPGRFARLRVSTAD